MEKILAVDYGDARIGLAVCDSLGILASPLKVLLSKGMKQDIDNIALVAKELNVQKILVGYPLNMDGTVGKRAEKSAKLAEVLKKVSGLQVELQDERLTTVEAEEILIARSMRREKRKEVIDMLSAQLFLQAYLDKNKIKNQE